LSSIYAIEKELTRIDILTTDPNTHDMMTILDEEELVASALVYPGSTEEVQKVVRWANKYLIPIFPISMGRNCKYLNTYARHHPLPQIKKH
jgi:FAD/FMN-containing dehydrogenase